MVSDTVIIRNPEGLTLKPAADFCMEAAKYQSVVTFTVHGHTANAKSVLSVLAACVVCGDEVTIECSGADEDEALKNICAVAEREREEQDG